MRDFFTEIYNIWITERPTQLAAALAYYGMFSFAPVIYLAFTVAGVFIDQMTVANQLYDKTQQFVGPKTAALMRELVLAISGYSRSGTLLVSLISFLVIFYAASGLFYQLQFALNTIWKVPPPQTGQVKVYIRRYLFSFVMVIGVGLLLILATMTNLLVTWFGSFLESSLGIGNSQVLLTRLATLALIVLSLALLYRVLPDVQIAWRDVWLGALAAGVLVMLAGLLAMFFFSLGQFGSAIEAAGAFTVFVMAIYYMAQIFLLGAVITRVYAARFGSRKPNQELRAPQLAVL